MKNHGIGKLLNRRNNEFNDEGVDLYPWIGGSLLVPGNEDIESDATPDAKTVGACGAVRAPQPMVGNRAMRVEMRTSSPSSLWLVTGVG